MESDYHWFAIQTKPSQEGIAQSVVGSLALEIFFPRVRRKNGAKRVLGPMTRPLFPGYLFARFSPVRHLHAVRYSRGVNRVVGSGETPLPVEDEIIVAIRDRVDEDGWVQLEERCWKPGDIVTLQDGPLRGWTGIFERELDDRRRVVILLNAIQLGRAVVEKSSLGTD